MPTTPVEDQLSTKAHQLADTWIQELTAAGFTHDQVLEVFRLAKLKYEAMKKKGRR